MNPRFSYREAAVQGSSPVRLVVLLYEQLIQDLRRALVALENNDITARTREINHAIVVLGYLQGTLDKERGGAVALNLERFYNQTRTGLLEAHCQQSPTLLERQIKLLMQVRQAWCEVERAVDLRRGPTNDQADRHPSDPGRDRHAAEETSQPSPTEWNA